jgi:hypothetical protein
MMESCGWSKKNQSFLIHKSYEGFEIMAEKFVPHFEGEDWWLWIEKDRRTMRLRNETKKY